MRRPRLDPLRNRLRSKLKHLRQGLGAGFVNTLAWQILSEKWEQEEGVEAPPEGAPQESEADFPEREGAFPNSSTPRP